MNALANSTGKRGNPGVESFELSVSPIVFEAIIVQNAANRKPFAPGLSHLLVWPGSHTVWAHLL